MGVYTTVFLSNGRKFGPLPTAIMIADPIYLIGQTTNDVLPELPSIHVNPEQMSEPTRILEWFSNVRPARHPQEQNLELVKLDALSQFFYQTTRQINPGEELLVWFRRLELTPLLLDMLLQDSNSSFDYVTNFNSIIMSNMNLIKDWLGKPQTLPHNSNSLVEEKQYTCRLCQQNFIYLYPFICHRIFKCVQLNTFNKLAHSVKNDPKPLRKYNELPPPASTWIQPQKALQAFMSDCFIHSAKVNSEPQKSIEKQSDFKDKGLPDPLKLILSHNNRKRKYGFGNKQESFCSVKSNKNLTKSHETNAAKTRNPMIENILKSIKSEEAKAGGNISIDEHQAVTSNQNWCAKCAASFRLTSDLVQHMRSFHKSDRTSCKIDASGKHQKLKQSSIATATSSLNAIQSKALNALFTSDMERFKKERNIGSPQSSQKYEFDQDYFSLNADYPYSCSVCGESFKSKHSLNRHTSGHANESNLKDSVFPSTCQ